MQGFIVTNLLKMLAHRLRAAPICVIDFVGAIGASGGVHGISSLCAEGAAWLCSS